MHYKSIIFGLFCAVQAVPSQAQTYEETAMFIVYGVKSGVSIKNRLGNYTLSVERSSNAYKLKDSQNSSIAYFEIKGGASCEFDTMYGVIPLNGDVETNYYKYKLNLQEIESLKVVKDASSPSGFYAEVKGVDPKCTIVSTSNTIKWNEKPCEPRFVTYATQDRLDSALAHLQKQYCPKRAF